MVKDSKRVQERVNGDVMDPRQVAEYFDFSESKVIRLLQKGELPGKKIGSQWRTRRCDLDKFMAETSVSVN